MDAQEFRRAGQEILDLIAEYLENIETRPVSSGLEPGDVRRRLPEHPPQQPEPFDAVRRDIDDIILPGLTHWQHPNFFAYFPGLSLIHI